MYVSLRADYALRALMALAVGGVPVTADELAEQLGLPPKYLGVVLAQLRRAGIVSSGRGRHAGYRLVVNPGQLTAADAVRAVDGLLAELPLPRSDGAGDGVRDLALGALWSAVQLSLRDALESVTIEQLAGGELPPGLKSAALARGAVSPEQ